MTTRRLRIRLQLRFARVSMLTSGERRDGLLNAERALAHRCDPVEPNA